MITAFCTLGLHVTWPGTTDTLLTIHMPVSTIQCHATMSTGANSQPSMVCVKLWPLANDATLDRLWSTRPG